MCFLTFMDMSLIASKAHTYWFVQVCQDRITAHRIAKIENANEISHHTIEAFKRGMTRWLQLQFHRHMQHMLANLRTWRPNYAKGTESFWGNTCSFVKLQIFRIDDSSLLPTPVDLFSSPTRSLMCTWASWASWWRLQVPGESMVADGWGFNLPVDMKCIVNIWRLTHRTVWS